VTVTVFSPQVEEWVQQYQQGGLATSQDEQKTLVDKWAEEMGGGIAKPADKDFWEVLEKQWDDLGQ